LTMASDTREVDVSSVSNIIDIVEVWSPYTAANPEDPPLTRGFQYWADQKTLYFNYPYRPVSGDIIRIFYQTLHTVDGLNSATTTTIPLDMESPFVRGCAGYAAQARARATTEEVVIDNQVPVSAQLMKWAIQKITEMDKAIDKTLEREGGGLAIIKQERLDKYEGAWS